MHLIHHIKTMKQIYARTALKYNMSIHWYNIVTLWNSYDENVTNSATWIVILCTYVWNLQILMILLSKDTILLLCFIYITQVVIVLGEETVKNISSSPISMWNVYICYCIECKGKATSYIAQYPVLRTFQNALLFISLADLFKQTPSQLL